METAETVIVVGIGFILLGGISSLAKITITPFEIILIGLAYLVIGSMQLLGASKTRRRCTKQEKER